MLHVDPAHRADTPTHGPGLAAGLALLVLLASCGKPPPPPPKPEPVQRPRRGEPLSFCTTEGNSANCLVATDRVTAHAVATTGKPARIVVAFPGGNAGGALWFGADQRLELRVAGKPATVSNGRMLGLRIDLECPARSVRLQRALLGSVRDIRAYQRTGTHDLARVVEAAAARLEALPAPIKARAARLGVTPDLLRKRAAPLQLKVRRKRPLLLAGSATSLDGKQRYLVEIASRAARFDADEQTLDAPSAPFDLQVSVLTSHPQLITRTADKIITSEGLSNLRDVSRRLGGEERKALRMSVHGLSFLTVQRKYLAGSWRFLTYFGRDTLMAMWLLQPALRLEAMEVALQSVLDRVSPAGRVAHEESLGDHAARVRLQMFTELAAAGDTEAALGQLQRLGQPVFDYKMLDDDLMLPLLLAAHFDDEAYNTRRARWFLARKKTRFGQLNMDQLARNLDFVLGRAAPYAGAGADDRVKHLLGLPEGQRVGDWRDSSTGLGGGRYPVSVNAYLMPAALDAIARLLASEKLDRGRLVAAAKRLGLKHLGAEALDARLDKLREAWRGAASHFEVSLPVDAVRKRLRTFLARGVPRAERRALEEREVGPGVRLRDLVRRGKLPPGLSGDARLTFHALALDADGRPLEVMNSDDGFALLAGPVPAEQLQTLLRKYELPYPLGLMDRHGFYVASPALSARTEDYKTFGRGAYHGTVVWSWHMSLLQRGLMIQLASLREQDSEQATALARRVGRLLRQLALAEERVGALITSELWTVELADDGFRAVPYGHAAGHATESNAVQLWSSVHVATSLQRKQLGVLDQ